MDHRSWRLPGPAAYVDRLIDSVRAGQHVVAVLPHHLQDDIEFTESLVLEVTRELRARDHECVRVDLANFVVEETEPGGAMRLRVPVESLLAEADLDGKVLLLADERAGASGEPIDDLLPTFIERARRLMLDLHPSQRATMLVVAGSGLVDWAPPRAEDGGEASRVREEVDLVHHWWWNCVTPFDVASLVDLCLRPVDEHRVTARMRPWIVVEVSRGDLDLAERLASSWQGDIHDLFELLGKPPSSEPVGIEAIQFDPLEPPDEVAARAAWNDGRVGAWNGRVEVIGHPLRSESVAARRIWRAQARVLMPELEMLRIRAEALVANLGGPLPTPEGQAPDLWDLVRHLPADSFAISGAIQRLADMTIQVRSGRWLEMAVISEALVEFEKMLA